ncbi:hypothetical protein BJF81_14840 [Ornithinimicrobium sp. CNJ-824]|uniref:hypothetical protein n=1 Tax=Ornithinimicrobium sp. CNJ-824 TaxID=1904966 RepID=UPI0009630660|nr:hypothetical protein [Ornithinimicrobium sp. CNJ-824]OLT21817.1 hypothetical protein BJF81_14840 [Ornithinimicrobium sp. CNJ-824]
MTMRGITLTAALGLSLVLAGCSDDGADEAVTPAATEEGTTEGTGDAGAEETDTTGGTADAAAAPMDDEVCVDFFQSGAVQLADRAETDRQMLDDAQVGDPASYGEISLLSQRIEDLVEDASTDQAQLLERINAPFVEVRDAVLDDPDQTVSDAEITVPEVDTTDSAAAQEEFLSSCTS